MVWDDNWYEVRMITSSAQLLHCQVNDRSKNYQFIVTIVYGFNTVEQRKSLWQEMKTISQGVTQPWLIAGDFNAILSTKDRLNGGQVTRNEIQDFGDCVRDMEITKLQWKGNYYTWNNKQCGEDRIASRIDRVFGNDEWMDKWGHVITEYGNPNISDHIPMMITLQKAHYFMDKIEMARVEIANVQDQLKEKVTDELVGMEKELLIKLEKWSMVEESALRQKSDIHEKFVSFYKSLMGTSTDNLPGINAQVMKRGPTLTKLQRIHLCAEVTEQEIYEGLKSIGNDKAPGVDGYNAYFFKYTWQVIKKDIIEAVQSSFTKGKLYKAFNCTLVSLIPKVQNPKSVKEYRPIACCTVIDLQKAYDIVEWTFLEQVMYGLGFPEMFVQWVSQSFEAAKGLRQGDPMSPFLFAIAMEYLSRTLKGLRDDKQFKYHPKCSKLDVTHLCFADDLLLFARGDLESVKAIQSCFSHFSQVSGLQANLNKSSIYCGGV
nr:uncharacterized protein LOC109120276 [Solanum lycopersicum]